MADHGSEPIPLMQQILDNQWILLILGIVFPTVLYQLWGVIEVISVPMGQ